MLTIVIALIAICQIWSLIKYIEKTNEFITRFFESIKYSDFAVSFPESELGSSFNDLGCAMNEVISIFQKTRAEKEERTRYLNNIIQHIGIGLISFNSDDGSIDLINSAAKKILNLSNPKNIRSLRPLSKDLERNLLKLKSREKALIKLPIYEDTRQLLVHVTRFKLSDRNYALASIQNIQQELEEKEMESWQNLIRILTHEIMNSVTPISSLASTAQDLLSKHKATNDIQTSFSDDKILDDLDAAIQTIQKRSNGLIKFINNYRNLSSIPEPNFQIIKIVSLFERAHQLMKTKLDEASIKISTRIDPLNLELIADPDLIEQVLINLILNSIQALKGKRNGRIELSARMDDRGKLIIEVTDNGPGIIPESVDKVFLPFYTTKRSGSGIGLSLSRQIMRLHGGTISLSSIPNRSTTFKLAF